MVRAGLMLSKAGVDKNNNILGISIKILAFALGVVSCLSIFAELPLYVSLKTAFSENVVVQILLYISGGIIDFWRAALPFERPQFDIWTYATTLLGGTIIGCLRNAWLFSARNWKGPKQEEFRAPSNLVNFSTANAIQLSAFVTFVALNDLLFPELRYDNLYYITTLSIAYAVIGIVGGVTRVDLHDTHSNVVNFFVVTFSAVAASMVFVSILTIPSAELLSHDVVAGRLDELGPLRYFPGLCLLVALVLIWCARLLAARRIAD